MSLVQTPLNDLTSAINTLAGVNLTGVYDIVGLVPTQVGESDLNTKLAIRAKATDATYRGEQVLYYDRLNLNDLVHLQPYMFKVGMPIGANLYDNLDRVLKQTGLRFTADDVEDAVTQEEGNDIVSVMLVAKSGSLGYVGSYKLLMADIPHISEAFYSSRLAGF